MNRLKVPAPDRGPAFAPRYVHSAFQIEALWVRAAKVIKLPGSAFFVLQHLLACQAKREGAQTRKGIAKASGVCLSSVKNGVKRLLAEGWVTEGPGGLEVQIFGRDRTPARRQDLTPPIIMEEKRAESSNAPHEAPEGPMPAPSEPVQKSKPSGIADPARPIAEALIKAGLQPRGAWSTARKVKPGACTWQDLLAAAQLVVNQRHRVHKPEGLLAYLVTRKGKAALRVIENAGRKPKAKPVAPKAPTAARNASPAFLTTPGALEALAELERMTTAKAVLGAEAPGFLDAMDRETQARRRVEDYAREALGALRVSELEDGLAPRLAALPSGLIRDRARRAHLGQALLVAVGLAV